MNYLSLCPIYSFAFFYVVLLWSRPVKLALKRQTALRSLPPLPSVPNNQLIATLDCLFD
jgi:hypothetical protein